MISEPYLGLLVGAGLSVVASVITLVLSNYYSERQWKMSRNLDQIDKVVDKVYSPLLFQFSSLHRTLTVFYGGLLSSSKEETSNLSLVRAKREFLSKNLSLEMKKTLLNSFGLVNPKGFREDLREFYIYLNEIEWIMERISENDNENAKVPEEISIRLRNLSDAANELNEIAIKFESFLEQLIGKSNQTISKIAYQRIFNEDLENKIEKSLYFI